MPIPAASKQWYIALMDVLGFEKLIYHIDKIDKIKKDQAQFPVNLTVSLGNYCNHGCRWCTVYADQEEKARHADLDRFVSLFRRGRDHGLKAVAYVGHGEPTAYPRFREMVTEVNGLGIEQGMFTNGYLLDRYRDEVLGFFTFVRISLDAGSTPVHNAMHDVNGHFDRIVDNIKTIIDRRKNAKPTIGIQYATHQDNLDDLYACAKLAGEIGVDYLSVKPVFNWGGGANAERIAPNRLTNDDLTPEVARLKKDFERGDFKILYRPFQIESVTLDRNVLEYDRCLAGFFNLNMYEDGSLTCCSPHRVGVGTIDDDMEALKSRIFEETNKLDLSKCPPSCRYHPMNHLIHTVLNPNVEDECHKNFI